MCAHRPRIVFLDTLRGFTILSMICFHAAYDLAYLYGFDMSWFTSCPLQDMWRISISWTFLILAGWMTSLSRNNLRRGAIYAAAALTVWVSTTIAAVDTPVNFGILFCMAACTLMWAGIERTIGRRPCRIPACLPLAFLALFFLTRQLPQHVYPISGFEWLGFPSEGFASGDYYPLLPYALLYLVGALGARVWTQEKGKYPDWMMQDFCAPLTRMGKLSLPIYLLHQPIILAALTMAFGT